MTETLLCLFAFAAGLLDAVVGGGGLIQLPALMVLLPKVELPTIFGTNKLVSFTGTSVAAGQYARRIRVDLGVTIPAAVAAFIASMAGAHAVTLVHPQVLRPLVLALLIAVAVYTAFRRDMGDLHAPRHTGSKMTALAVVAGGVIGFYDGFFGPGTGTFLVFVFISLFGFDFLSASASAKVVNVGTNLAALILFAATKHVLYLVALPMIACNMLGAVVGSRLAILRGNAWVRKLFLTVVTMLIAKMAWDTFAR